MQCTVVAINYLSLLIYYNNVCGNENSKRHDELIPEANRLAAHKDIRTFFGVDNPEVAVGEFRTDLHIFITNYL
jgi:hypothetical protein